jgi:hypothetical protein
MKRMTSPFIHHSKSLFSLLVVAGDFPERAISSQIRSAAGLLVFARYISEKSSADQAET